MWISALIVLGILKHRRSEFETSEGFWRRDVLAEEVVEGGAVEADVLALGIDVADVGALTVDAQVLLQDGVERG